MEDQSNSEKLNQLKESYKKYEENRELVTDDNPYSRLYALKRMGIVDNYEQIADKTVLVIGVGGVGSVTAEMLTRIGVGKLVLFDYDKVEIANMNRLFYTPNQVGLTKVEAARLTLEGINPRVIVEAFNGDITVGDGYDTLRNKIKTGGLNGQEADLVLSCTDNYAARMTVNNVCNDFNQIWIESGVSEDALCCHYQVTIPGETACFACMPPLAVVENKPKIKREGVCAASLPTTMGITAGLMVHTAMKILLEFEEVAFYVQYNARNEYFNKNHFKPNPECNDRNCKKRQLEKEGQVSWKEKRDKVVQEKRNKTESHFNGEEDEGADEWEIELIEEDNLVREAPDNSINKAEAEAEQLDDLMAQLKSL